MSQMKVFVVYIRYKNILYLIVIFFIFLDSKILFIGLIYIFLYFFIKILINKYYLFNKIILYFYLGIGDWGLGIGDWGVGIGPNPQSPIPNPQSPIPNPHNII